MSNAKIFIISLITFTFIALIAGSVSGAVFFKNGTEIESDEPLPIIFADPNSSVSNYSIQFFYNTHCGACHEAMAYLDGYKLENPDTKIAYHDLFNNTESRELFEEHKAAYNRQYVSVPVIFIGNIGLEGQYAISSYFGPLSEWYASRGEANLSLPLFSIPFNPANTDNGISIPLIIVAGLLDGINPCAFAVLVFLLVYLMSISDRKRMLLAGIVYTAAVFFFYYLSGVGIFTIIQTTGMVQIFSVFAGCVAFIAGFLMLKDALIPGIGPSLAIPESRKATINRYIEKTTIPAAFILGILVGMFELPCTGGIYLAILSMISLRVDLAQGLMYLVIYNLAFILPLIIIIALVYWGMPPEKVNEWRVEQRKSLKFIIGLIMIGFAILIFTGKF